MSFFCCLLSLYARHLGDDNTSHPSSSNGHVRMKQGWCRGLARPPHPRKDDGPKKGGSGESAALLTSYEGRESDSSPQHTLKGGHSQGDVAMQSWVENRSFRDRQSGNIWGEPGWINAIHRRENPRLSFTTSGASDAGEPNAAVFETRHCRLTCLHLVAAFTDFQPPHPPTSAKRKSRLPVGGEDLDCLCNTTGKKKLIAE